MDECGEKNVISFLWGRWEIWIFGEGIILYVNGVFYDMIMMLEIICGVGVRLERIFLVRWIFLLRGWFIVLLGCESFLVMVWVFFGYMVRCLFLVGEKGYFF